MASREDAIRSYLGTAAPDVGKPAKVAKPQSKQDAISAFLAQEDVPLPKGQMRLAFENLSNLPKLVTEGVPKGVEAFVKSQSEPTYGQQLASSYPWTLGTPIPGAMDLAARLLRLPHSFGRGVAELGPEQAKPLTTAAAEQIPFLPWMSLFQRRPPVTPPVTPGPPSAQSPILQRSLPPATKGVHVPGETIEGQLIGDRWTPDVPPQRLPSGPIPAGELPPHVDWRTPPPPPKMLLPGVPRKRKTGAIIMGEGEGVPRPEVPEPFRDIVSDVPTPGEAAHAAQLHKDLVKELGLEEGAAKPAPEARTAAPRGMLATERVVDVQGRKYVVSRSGLKPEADPRRGYEVYTDNGYRLMPEEQAFKDAVATFEQSGGITQSHAERLAAARTKKERDKLPLLAEQIPAKTPEEVKAAVDRGREQFREQMAKGNAEMERRGDLFRGHVRALVDDATFAGLENRRSMSPESPEYSADFWRGELKKLAQPVPPGEWTIESASLPASKGSKRTYLGYLVKDPTGATVKRYWVKSAAEDYIAARKAAAELIPPPAAPPKPTGAGEQLGLTAPKPKPSETGVLGKGEKSRFPYGIRYQGGGKLSISGPKGEMIADTDLAGLKRVLAEVEAYPKKVSDYSMPELHRLRQHVIQTVKEKIAALEKAPAKPSETGVLGKQQSAKDKAKAQREFKKEFPGEPLPLQPEGWYGSSRRFTPPVEIDGQLYTIAEDGWVMTTTPKVHLGRDLGEIKNGKLVEHWSDEPIPGTPPNVERALEAHYRKTFPQGEATPHPREPELDRIQAEIDRGLPESARRGLDADKPMLPVFARGKVYDNTGQEVKGLKDLQALRTKLVNAPYTVADPENAAAVRQIDAMIEKLAPKKPSETGVLGAKQAKKGPPPPRPLAPGEEPQYITNRGPERTEGISVEDFRRRREQALNRYQHALEDMDAATDPAKKAALKARAFEILNEAREAEALLKAAEEGGTKQVAATIKASPKFERTKEGQQATPSGLIEAAAGGDTDAHFKIRDVLVPRQGATPEEIAASRELAGRLWPELKESAPGGNEWQGAIHRWIKEGREVPRFAFNDLSDRIERAAASAKAPKFERTREGQQALIEGTPDPTLKLQGQESTVFKDKAKTARETELASQQGEIPTSGTAPVDPDVSRLRDLVTAFNRGGKNRPNAGMVSRQSIALKRTLRDKGYSEDQINDIVDWGKRPPLPTSPAGEPKAPPEFFGASKEGFSGEGGDPVLTNPKDVYQIIKRGNGIDINDPDLRFIVGQAEIDQIPQWARGKGTLDGIAEDLLDRFPHLAGGDRAKLKEDLLDAVINHGARKADVKAKGIASKAAEEAATREAAEKAAADPMVTEIKTDVPPSDVLVDPVEWKAMGPLERRNIIEVFRDVMTDESGRLDLARIIKTLHRWRTRFPMEEAVRKAMPNSPTIAEVERWTTGLADGIARVAETGWWKGVKKLNPEVIKDQEEAAVNWWRPRFDQIIAQRDAALQQAQTAQRRQQIRAQAARDMHQIEQQARTQFFSPELQQEMAYRDAAFARENASRAYFGLDPIDKTPGPYIPRRVDPESREAVSLGAGALGRGRGPQTTVGPAGKERTFQTFREGEQGTGHLEYEDPRNSILLREWEGIKLRATHRLFQNLENKGTLFRDKAAADAASPTGRAWKIENAPGGDWWVPTEAEAKFLRQNLTESQHGPTTSFVGYANALFRNPNLVNPAPHVVKNMAIKALLARGPVTPYVLARDAVEYLRGRNPGLLREFHEAMPFSTSGKPAAEVLGHELKSGTVGDAVKKALHAIGTVNRPSQKVIFEWADPAMRYALFKHYRQQGMGVYEAGNHAWVDLIRYGTRGQVTDMWKAWPLNFFVPWRYGTFVSLMKQVQNHPVRTALLIGAVDYLREIRYRQSGKWTHLPWDYVTGPIAQIVQSKSLKELGVNLGSQAAITALFGPGGAFAAQQMTDIIRDAQGKGDWGRLRNMFWGLSQMYELPKEFERGDYSGMLGTILLGEHQALTYEPRRLGKALPESLPFLKKSVLVESAERMQADRERRRHQREERPKSPTIEERLRRAGLTK